MTILLRILRNDVSRRKGALSIVFVFVMLSAFLAACGATLMIGLTGSLDRLFLAAKVPHFVQMHSGPIDREALEFWASTNKSVENMQVSRMISIEGRSLFLGSSGDSEAESVMDISLVRQNREFDYLLGSDNRVLRLKPGEIGVPIYYAEKNGLNIGDTVKISTGDHLQLFVIAAWVRDPQMNPAVVHSKRFLVSDGDYEELKRLHPDCEFLIEFRLLDPELVDEFSQAYLASGLPKLGPSVDYRLFRMLNALSDGLVVGVILALSGLLMLIALLCLRFTILAALEDDYREIGVMKAVGMSGKDIKRIYISKYVALGGLASLSGYLVSLPVGRYLTAHLQFSMGPGATGLIPKLLPLLSVFITFFILLISSHLVLRRFRSIAAVEALRAGARTEGPANRRGLALSRCRILDLNVFLGFRDVVQRFGMFGLLLFVYFFSAFITILPVHFLSTIRSPDFVSYMGIGECDIRIDLRHTAGMEARFEDMIRRIESDEDVAAFSPFITSQTTLVLPDSETENLIVETGDFSLFPPDYIQGGTPSARDDIALSYLNARDLGVTTGDILVLRIDGVDRKVRVSGIYQDVTNGGRTAKADFPVGGEILWYTMSLDLFSTDGAAAKRQEYAEAFFPARVTDLKGYLSQTLGNTIDQLEMVTWVAIAVGLAVAMLITSLFLRMLISRDAGRIAVMRSLGFPLTALRLQYASVALVVLGLGIVAGSLFANTGGQRLVGAIISFLGAAQVRFIVNPVQSYVLLPMALLASVSFTAALSLGCIRNQTSTAGIAE
jgi:putative ABC transport system permease protein